MKYQSMLEIKINKLDIAESYFKGKANPKLAKIITLSSDIEITDLRKLKKLSDVF